jgi:hypothetical protein
MNLTFGCGDECDIILSDASVGEKAFELEVTSERVVAIMPGGKTVKLEPYHVTQVGASALVVGPQEGTWKTLVWPKAEVETSKDDEEKVETDDKEHESAKKCFPFGCAFVIFAFIALSAFGFFAWKKYPAETKEYSLKAWCEAKKIYCAASEKFKREPIAIVTEIVESLDDIAKDCGFTVVRTGEEVSVKGDFKTRVMRLEATARACAAHPGLKVDFADAESLGCAVNEFLFLVSENELKLDRLEGRKAFLSGRAASRGHLEKILRSMSEDVPKISKVDCSRVSLGGDICQPASNNDDGGEASPLKRKNATKSTPTPKMPIAGILTVPYPCLVLNDGTRAMEGARFGEFTIEKIKPDSITVRGADGTFEWRP